MTLTHLHVSSPVWDDPYVGAHRKSGDLHVSSQHFQTKATKTAWRESSRRRRRGIAPDWTLQQSMAKSTERQVQQFAYQGKL